MALTTHIGLGVPSTAVMLTKACRFTLLYPGFMGPPSKKRQQHILFGRVYTLPKARAAMLRDLGQITEISQAVSCFPYLFNGVNKLTYYVSIKPN